MKQVILIRHAKSSWSDFSMKDFDRPLNERGKHDAPMMAQRLLDKKIPVDAFVSSPAKRAKKTAEVFAETYGKQKDTIIFIDQLYLADPGVFFEVISQLDDRFDTVAIFSHNNGLTDFANQLTDTRIDEIPTCGMFAIRASVKYWKDFQNSAKQFWFADFPKAAG